MANMTDEFRKEVNKLWSQAIDQLEEIKETVLRTNDRVEAEVQRLRLERDKLLRRLGEQTLKLANQQTVPLPAVLKRTVEQLNDVIESLTDAQSGRKKRGTKKKKKAASKKKVTRKKTTKKKVTKKKTTKAASQKSAS